MSCYSANTLYLIVDGTAHGVLSTAQMAMLAFVILLPQGVFLVVDLPAVRQIRRGNTELDR